jgi:hypothetical protein
MAEKLADQNPEARIERAEQLAREAQSYWQLALRGLFAFPNATALSVSSAILYLTGIAEQSYRRIESLSGRISSEVTREISEATRATLPEPDRVKRQPTA